VKLSNLLPGRLFQGVWNELAHISHLLGHRAINPKHASLLYNLHILAKAYALQSIFTMRKPKKITVGSPEL
jgi:hypothetical protein